VLVFGIVLEALSLAGCMREVNKIRAGRSWWQWFRESRQSELVVVFGEDIAALFGLVFALVAIFIAMLTGNAQFDAIGSIAIGVLLIVVAIGASIEVKALLVGQSAEAPMREAINGYVRGSKGVVQLLNVITLHFGDDVMVAVKAKMDGAGSAADLCATINGIELGIKRQFPQVKWVFFEPDVVD
jgi:divalent metal cation (Fe/Co/Zn/Cd) transporter